MPLLFHIWIPDAIGKLYLRFIVPLPVVFDVMWIRQVPIPVKPISVSEMFSGKVSSSLQARWWSIHFIQRTLNNWVRAPGWVFADEPAGTGDIPNNLKASAPSCWKYDHDVLTIFSVSEMYSTAVMSWFWARDSFCLACRFWLPCHISKTLWTLAILGNFFCSTSLSISRSLSVFIIFNARSSLANNRLLARAHCLSPTVLCWVRPAGVTAICRSHLAQRKSWPPLPQHVLR